MLKIGDERNNLKNKSDKFGLEPAPLTEFPTAFEMTKQNLGLV
jgi:hypothetical protein